ncbi:MAG: DEAD/DEAH box helicase, partial [Methanocorpusculum sp.]|nr:DEAD/DEAH box helicase [Methanocorpusculum sp.]
MADAVVFEKTYDAKLPEFRKPQVSFSEKISDYLDSKKIKLYNHQADAYDAICDGKNIIITTPTASGKTLCYTLPIFDNLMKNSDARALFIYPTKALTRDQLISIKEIDSELNAKTKPAVYDGDTKTENRSAIRETSRVILTNMYELHQILPYRAKWGDFFTNLSFIVIDEAHKYRGVFGSNTALLIRRLRRICNYYDANPQFILSSATLGNSVNFAETLCGVSFDEINNDGSPHAKKIFRIYNDPNKTSIASAANLVSENIKSGRQTICFTKSRTTAEITAVKCRDSKIAGNIASYRGGYRPDERRRIEANLKNGEVSGVFSTNALEVGIDIGGLDSVVISGFPGSMTSFLQQAGRAGRKYQDSEITFVAGQSPIDQYYVKNPDSFFDLPTEEAILGIENPYILSAHLLCACSELPYNSVRDRKYFGKTADDLIENLREKRTVASTKRGYVYCGTENPAQTNTFFGTIGKIWAVVFGKNTLETMDDS